VCSLFMHLQCCWVVAVFVNAIFPFSFLIPVQLVLLVLLQQCLAELAAHVHVCMQQCCDRRAFKRSCRALWRAVAS
jgi:hypothetical protein